MSVLTAFNNHFEEFVDDILRIFPENMEIKKAKLTIEMLRKANPRSILLIWKDYIGNKYRDQIENSDIRFFIEKDYSNDVLDVERNERVMEIIEKMRTPVREMGAENQKKAMKYIQNLTKLSDMYQ
jgi:hypothetical protein